MNVNNSVKRIFGIIVAVVVLALSLANCNLRVLASSDNSSNATTTGNADVNSVVSYIDTEMNKLVNDKRVKGITVSIAGKDGVLLSKGYGYADEKNGIKVDPGNSIFRIGSVSKTFISIAAMQMVEQGKLDMKAPVSKYLEKDFPKLKYPVTMENLLTHTAGFDEMYLYSDAATEKDLIPLDKFLKKYMPKQVYKPGEVSSYSNYGASLAAHVIERISGLSFYDYAQEKIFKPLKMDNTTFRPVSEEKLAKPYSTSGKEGKGVLLADYPSGSVTTTAKDMTKYMNFLMGDKNQYVLNNKEKQDMFSNHFTMAEGLSGFGYIWERHEINGHNFYTHGGSTSGFISQLALYPEQGLSFFISCNQSGDFELAEYVFKTAEMLYGKEKEKNTYTGKLKTDISGYYMPVRAVVNGPDKFLNYVLYSPFKISGNLKDGFRLNGEKLIPVAEDAFKMDDATFIKFTQKGDSLYFAPKQYYSSYVRVPFNESMGWQLFVIAFFVLISVIGLIVFVVLIISALKKKKTKLPFLPFLPFAAAFIAFITMVIRTITHINYITENFGILNSIGFDSVLTFIKVCAYFITFLGLCGIVSTIYLWIKKQKKLLCIFYSIWSLAVILFISWLIQLNLVL